MIRPDAIPLTELTSRVTLPPPAVAALFGKDYRWRGSERVRLVGTGRGEVSIIAVAGSRLVLEVDRLDEAVLGGKPSRVVGPRGTIDAPELQGLGRILVLPSGLLRSWKLEPSERVALQVGSVIFTDVVVAEGQPAGAGLARADLLTTGLDSTATARLRRDFAEDDLSTPTNLSIPRRLITENDVRQARLHGRRILVGAGQIITPAAKSLGRELGILDWAEE